MISDEDVIQFYKKLDTPGGYKGLGTPQIFRGKTKQPPQGEVLGGCLRHHEVFNKYRIIPEYCFDCYKVLIAPRTVVELFKLLIVFDRLSLPNDNFRKCMVEGRDDCSGAYKGFIFCMSMEEGKEVRKIAREVVRDEISPQIPVNVKRGCSEFAAAYPSYSPSKPGAVFMKYNKDWKVYEELVDKTIVINANSPRARGEVPSVNNDALTTYTSSEILAMQFWLRYAATIGDMSYLRIAGGTLPPIPNLKRPPFTTAVSRAARK
ncbi:MAG: zinc ribbon-containing protein [Sulfuricaulis sp.]